MKKAACGQGQGPLLRAGVEHRAQQGQQLGGDGLGAGEGEGDTLAACRSGQDGAGDEEGALVIPDERVVREIRGSDLAAQAGRDAGAEVRHRGVAACHGAQVEHREGKEHAALETGEGVRGGSKAQRRTRDQLAARGTLVTAPPDADEGMTVQKKGPSAERKRALWMVSSHLRSTPDPELPACPA